MCNILPEEVENNTFVWYIQMIVLYISSFYGAKSMRNVVYFDWELTPEHPFSYMERSYDEQSGSPVPDMHSALHLGVVLRGYREGVFSGVKVETSENEVYLTAPWEVHHTVCTGNHHRLLLFNIDRNSLQECFFTGAGELEQLMVMSPGMRMKHINEKLHSSSVTVRLLEAIRLPDSPRKELIIWNLLQQLFITVLPEPGGGGDHTADHQRLLPALKALSGKKLSVPEAAAKCCLSTNYFAVLFKKQFGLSFARYERNFRLNGALHALRRGAPFKEAADAWGFCDKSHLAKMVKKRP